MDLLISRITLNSDICHGKPTIRNKRYTVDLILDLLSSGKTEKRFWKIIPHWKKMLYAQNT
jgi:uncharacterized protein (DUF433 family)